MSDFVPDAVRRTLHIEERRLWQIRTHEEAVLIDSFTGDIKWRRVGTAASVEFSPGDHNAMQGHILTHNHPLGWRFPSDDPRHTGSSFSAGDVAMLVTTALLEIRAVSPGYLHRLRAPGQADDSLEAAYYRRMIQSLSFDEVVYQARQFSLAARVVLQNRLNGHGQPLTDSEIAADHRHEAIQLLSLGWGVNYKRKEWIG